ncbi:MAG: hypothetical protein QF922_09055 [SAR324 cluster bacterium]|nr:hypothetical protein [SAR324 cluster bacterium]
MRLALLPTIRKLEGVSEVEIRRMFRISRRGVMGLNALFQKPTLTSLSKTCG